MYFTVTDDLFRYTELKLLDGISMMSWNGDHDCTSQISSHIEVPHANLYLISGMSESLVLHMIGHHYTFFETITLNIPDRLRDVRH